MSPYTKGLKETASEYVILFGYFSDEVAYCAADIALPMEAIPKKYHWFMNDTSLTVTDTRRGALQKVGQVKPGHGDSTHPHAVYGLNGPAPCATTYGAGRHQPLG